MSTELVEILEFTHFFEHFAFLNDGRNSVEKVLMNEVTVKVGIDMVTGNI